MPLCLTVFASKSQIRVAYREHILKSHPDRVGVKITELSNATFRAAKEAWDILQRPTKSKYDKQRNTAQPDLFMPSQAGIEHRLSPTKKLDMTRWIGNHQMHVMTKIRECCIIRAVPVRVDPEC